MRSCLFLFFLAACDYAPANKQTLTSEDCGVTWSLVHPGEAVPRRQFPCQYKVMIPDFPMQGDVSFKASFKNRVLANIEVSYEYQIVDGIKFIQEAKFLGSTAAESEAGAYESAENSVIDKRIREAVTALLVDQDIVEFSQAEFEVTLQDAVNKLLEERGVRLNFLSFVPVPEEQTRLAIDTMTAMKIYESRNLSALGEDVIAARAGATQINIVGKKE